VLHIVGPGGRGGGEGPSLRGYDGGLILVTMYWQRLLLLSELDLPTHTQWLQPEPEVLVNAMMQVRRTLNQGGVEVIPKTLESLPR
jgi:hypothetical protein